MELAPNFSHPGQWFRAFVFSIRGKMILFACFIAFSATYLIGNLYALRMAQDLGTQRLVSQTRLLAPQFQNTFNEMKQAAITLSHVPDIEGIERAAKNGGRDPVEGSSINTWRERLSHIFIDQIRARPYYMQMRYITVRNDGMEVVRVNNSPSKGIMVVSDADLKPKAKENFYIEALQTGTAEKDVYFSGVTLNREDGVTEIPYRPVIRVIRTIRGDAGTPIGMVVIIADYYDLIRRTMSGILTHEDIYIFNSENDYVMQNAQGEISPYHYRSDIEADIPPVIRTTRNLPVHEKTFKIGHGPDTNLVHAVRLYYDDDFPDRWIGIAMSVPRNKIYEAPTHIARDTTVLASGFAVIACILAMLVARMFIRPLQQMNAEVQAYADGKREKLDLPVNLKDELGIMARSLANMAGKLNKYYADLERSNRELDDFAYIASHDLKEPLRAISNHTTFLYEDHVRDMDDDAKSRVDRIKKLCERAEKLVSELLYFSRLGRGDMAETSLDLNEMVADIKGDLSSMLEEHNAEIIVAQDLPHIMGDAVRITSVFQNLIINGIKYNDSVDKKIEIGYLPSALHNGVEERSVFFVRDNGIGIAAEFHDHVFRLFKRLNSPQKYGEGTGAGLTFVKKIIERHKGKIWLESAAGEGSTFYFTLK